MEIIYINGPITDANIMEKDFADAADLALFFEDNNIPYTVEYRAVQGTDEANRPKPL